MKPVSLPELVQARTNVRPNADAGNLVPAEAWQREMEKAQAAMWLGHDPVGTGARSLDGASHREDQRAGVASARQNRQHERTALESRDTMNRSEAGDDVKAARAVTRIQLAPGLFTAATPLADPEFVQPASLPQPQQAVLSGIGAVIASAASTAVEVFPCNEPPRHLATPVAVTGSRVVPSDDDVATQAAPTAQASAAPPQDEPDPQAVRVYCQFTADGLLVWIGAAAHSGFNAQTVAAQLQQALARQSQRLAGFTCNGRAVALQPDSFILPTHKEPSWRLEQ